MLSERQRDLLYMYHDFLRGRGMTVCERVPQPVGPARHRAAPPARVQEIVERFEPWRARVAGRYSRRFYRLHIQRGQQAAASLPLLRRAMCAVLLSWATLHPDGVWEVSA